MKDIRPKVKEKNGHKWITVDGGGNVRAEPGEEITWSHQEKNLPADFLATFKEMVKPGESPRDWPFDSGSPPLRLNKAQGSSWTVRLKSDPDLDWEYKIEVEGSNDIDKLDPMIIIRGRNPFGKIALAAIAGAVVGALLFWLLVPILTGQAS